MADRAHHGRSGSGHRPQQRLVAEGQQILDAAASPGDHDHVDLGIAVEPFQCGDNLGDRGRALRRGVLDAEPDGGQSPPRVLHDIVLGRAGPPGDDADAAREEWQRAFSLTREQTLGREQSPKRLEPGEQLAQPDEAHLGLPAG